MSGRFTTGTSRAPRRPRRPRTLSHAGCSRAERRRARSAQRYVAAFGGVDEVVRHARRAFDEGDHRWAAQLLDHALFAEPGHPDARALQADAFEQLAFATENGTWRCSYLAGAKELRAGPFGTPAIAASADLVAALTVPEVCDSLAVRVDGPRARDHHLAICRDVTDEGATHVTELRKGALNHRTIGDGTVEVDGDRDRHCLTAAGVSTSPVRRCSAPGHGGRNPPAAGGLPRRGTPAHRPSSRRSPTSRRSRRRCSAARSRQRRTRRTPGSRRG